MRLRLDTSLALALLLLVAPATSGAASSIRYGWDDCSNTVVNKDWSGPGVYSQVMTLTGMDEPFNGFSVVIVNTAGWSYGWGWCSLATWCPVETGDDHGCVSRRAEATAGVAGCDSIPGLTITRSDFTGGVTSPRGYILIEGSVPAPVRLDPGRRYGLFTAAYHLDGPGTNPPAPPCSDVLEPRCFHVVWHGFGLIENEFVSWNDPANSSNCPFATPVRDMTWGRLKSHYR